jgi:putative endonuclease
MFHVYAIYSPKANKIYIGQTSDLKNRLQQHNGESPFKQWTHRAKPWELIYSESCETRQRAMLREKQLKSGAGRTFLRTKLKEYLERKEV